jgi:hypothetical protein
MRNRALLLGLAIVVAAGCQVKETEDAEGNDGVQIEPAPINIEADTKTVVVPDVDIGRDTTATTTTY